MSTHINIIALKILVKLPMEMYVVLVLTVTTKHIRTYISIYQSRLNRLFPLWLIGERIYKTEQQSKIGCHYYYTFFWFGVIFSLL